MIEPFFGANFSENWIGNLALVVAIILTLLVGKDIAAEIAGKIFGYTRAARTTMVVAYTAAGGRNPRRRPCRV